MIQRSESDFFATSTSRCAAYHLLNNWLWSFIVSTSIYSVPYLSLPVLMREALLVDFVNPRLYVIWSSGAAYKDSDDVFIAHAYYRAVSSNAPYFRDCEKLLLAVSISCICSWCHFLSSLELWLKITGHTVRAIWKAEKVFIWVQSYFVDLYYQKSRIGILDLTFQMRAILSLNVSLT